MSKCSIRALSVNDWALYKSLRLRALQDSPEAFDSTFASESMLQDSAWMAKLERGEHKTMAIPLVAEIDGKPQGLVWGVQHSNNDKAGYIYQMWVAADARGNGVGRELLDAVIAWARAAQLDWLELSVTPSNAAAILLYQSAGVEYAGNIEGQQAASLLKSHSMVLSLHDGIAR
ncbi:GNAT family N-acetyltransferase [Alteromonas gilva]|uniref:GNAT family N-acetyltransferase n=1 Tax=Alteromonas gilva TaxID=2987522 RepID=A0ABT5L149_9ALTE|nr:GNAT family N-acetyltransferase [Alteromonas gilva]MDC8830612.1 GNAT family N-acetyltransferase [Alteromonas gilva]